MKNIKFVFGLPKERKNRFGVQKGGLSAYDLL